MEIISLLRQPWPWYVAGPLIGLTVPLLLFLGNKEFGVSSNLRHVCAMLPSKLQFFKYDWRSVGGWNVMFAVGLLLGGFVGGFLLGNPEALHVSPKTTAELAALGVSVDGGFVPASLFSWANLFTWQGFVFIVVGGFLIGFGTAYAGGCTSGHAIMGLSALQLPSLVAVIGFFVGGLVVTHVLLPLLLRSQ
jgi:uncharacterized protein